MGTYFSFSPAFFFDYFALNNYAECRTFMTEGFDILLRPHIALYAIDPTKLDSFFFSNRHLMLLFFAEKREDGTTTFDKLPICEQYRTAMDDDIYKKVAKELTKPFCLTALLNDINVIQEEQDEVEEAVGNLSPNGVKFLKKYIIKKEFGDNTSIVNEQKTHDINEFMKLTTKEQGFGTVSYNPQSKRGYQFLHYFRNI